MTRPAPNALGNPPIILSSTSQKIAYYFFLIPIQYLFFLYYSFFLYSCRLLLRTIAAQNESQNLAINNCG